MKKKNSVGFEGNLLSKCWMAMENTKTISYHHGVTFNDWELFWIFGKDYNKQAVIISTRQYA